MSLDGGTAKEVLKHPNPLLREISEIVEDPTSDEIQDLVKDLFATMLLEKGTGIAAPQIGIRKRVLVYFISSLRAQLEGSKVIPITPLANPVILHKSDEVCNDWEGCLSVPGLRGLVSRSNTITYSAVNIKTGETIKETVSGFHARVLQHEIDHLDGILYIDKMLESKEV